AEYVRPKRRFELLDGDVLDRLLLLLVRGVVHENVKPAERLDGFVDETLASVRALHIESLHDAAPPRLFDPALCLARVFFFFFGVVADSHVGTFAREGDRDGPADPAVAAGDD